MPNTNIKGCHLAYTVITDPVYLKKNNWKVEHFLCFTKLVTNPFLELGFNDVNYHTHIATGKQIQGKGINWLQCERENILVGSRDVAHRWRRWWSVAQKGVMLAEPKNAVT